MIEFQRTKSKDISKEIILMDSLGNKFKKHDYLLKPTSKDVGKTKRTLYQYQSLCDLDESELYLIYRIDECRRNQKVLIGDGPLTERMMIILLQYVYRGMNLDSFEYNPFKPLSIQTFIYLCETQEQKCHFQRLAKRQCCLLYHQYKHLKLRFIYCFGSLSESDRKREAEKIFNINKKAQKQKTGYDKHIPEFEFRREVKRQIIVATIEEYAQYLINTNPVDITPADFMFMEPCSLQKFTQNAFHLQINETIIRRAWIQHKKLQKFYNFKLNRGQNDQINALFYKVKQRVKQNIKTKHSSANSFPKDLHLDQNFMESKFLLNLSFIGYLINSLIAEERQLKLKRSGGILPVSSREYIKDICNKLLIHRLKLKQAHQIFKDMLSYCPPKIVDIELSTVYTLKICQFFEKVIVWDELFNDKYPRFLQIIKQKTVDSYQIQTACFEHKILFERMMKQCTSCAIIQSMLPPKYLFDMVFKLVEYSQRIVYSRNQRHDMHEKDNKHSRYQKHQKQKLQHKKSIQVNNNNNKDNTKDKDEQQKQKQGVTGLIISLTSSEQDLILPPVQYFQDISKHQMQSKTQTDQQMINQTIRSYGVLIYDICQTTTDGIIVYFGCREHLIMCRKEWEDKEGIYKKINDKKIIFQESPLQQDNIRNVQLFKKYNDIGRGAIYFISAVGPLATYQKFPDHYSNCVIFVSLPTLSPAMTAAKLSYLQLKEYHRFDLGLAIVAKCLNNCISTTGYPKTIAFASRQFRRQDLSRKWFPFVKQLNLTTVSIVEMYIEISIKELFSEFICDNYIISISASMEQGTQKQREKINEEDQKYRQIHLEALELN